MNSTDAKITVFLADDHAIVRDGLRSLLDDRDEFVVVAEAETGRDAVRLVRELCPDIVVMDIAMPELNGIEATRIIGSECPETRVVVLSMHGTKEHIFRALQAGARGYLLKRSAGSELIDAVLSVSRGERYLSKHITDIVVEDYVAKGDGDRELDPLSPLSVREREVLQLVAEGNDNSTIAAKLNLSPKSIHTYRSRIMQKLDLHSRAELMRSAVHLSLGTSGEIEE